jgi:hypothetical protein
VTRFADRTPSLPASLSAWIGSGTQRLLCLPVQSTSERQTRGEEQWHGPPRGEADAHTRNPFHAKMRSRAPSKLCLIATFLLRFHPLTTDEMCTGGRAASRVARDLLGSPTDEGSRAPSAVPPPGGAHGTG